ncbi:MAG: mechanosensitive ion channel [Alphaproteobacteria bacterium]|nr:mechanosensitive ion channel [Alphaproteobacteria bacterium]
MIDLSPYLAAQDQVLLLTVVLCTAMAALVWLVSRRALGTESLAGVVTWRLALFGAVCGSGAALLYRFGVDVLGLAERAGNAPLITISGIEVTAVTVVVFVVLLGLAWYSSILAREGMGRALNARKLGDPGTVAAFSRLVQYAVGGLGVAVALQSVGIDLGALVTAGAVFAVGIGFAMQNIAQNFVSGVILLAERSISPGDIVEVDGRMVRIRVLGIRSTIATTRDDEELIIPNSFLVQSNVKNFTLNDDSLRVRLPVGVAYESDLDLVLRTLVAAAKTMPSRIEARDPVVVLTAFGSSSVDFEVSVWIKDPWRSQQARSELAFVVWNALKAAEITIAFPQVDVHFDPGVLVPKPAAPKKEPAAQA